MNLKHLEKMIKPYKPLHDFDTIVIETNKIFHSFDAKNYDEKHVIVFDRIPQLYKEMCSLLPKDKNLKILNFGCGTGLEASQLLKNLKNIEVIYCYDISEEMVNFCKVNLKKWEDKIVFLTNTEDIPKDIKFDVLLTNSLLHHLPKPIETINELEKYLSKDSFYIMGHEPSIRYFNNKEVEESLKIPIKPREYSFVVRNLRRLVNVKHYPHYIKKLLRIKPKERENSYTLTADIVVEKGLFEIQPPNQVIIRLIDCNVPENASEKSGFDFRNISLHNDWDLIYSKTYNFLSDEVPFRKMSKEDQKKYIELEEKYPDDGLNFCCLWKRKDT